MLIDHAAELRWLSEEEKGWRRKTALTVELAAVSGNLDGDEYSFHGPNYFLVAMRRVAIVQEIRLDVPMTIKDDVTELKEEGLPLNHISGCPELYVESVF